MMGDVRVTRGRCSHRLQCAVPSRPQSADTRLGFTLLEVLLATAILAGALTALSQLSTNGVNAALRIELETQAAVICQSKLDELLATSEPIEIGRATPFSAAPDWSWRVELTDGPSPSLALLTVCVERQGRWNTGATFQLQRLVTRRSLLERRQRHISEDAP